MRWPLVVVIALILMSSSNQVIIGVGTPSAEHVKVTSSPLFAVLSSGFRTIVGFTENTDHATICSVKVNKYNAQSSLWKIESKF